MTREEAKKLLPVIKAFTEGKKIETRYDIYDWTETEVLHLESKNEYRIKPEPKYRPFETQEECWNEMHKHPDFGWVVTKNCRVMYHIDSIHNALLIGYIGYSFDEMYQKFEFLDGTPFGVKEEE